MRLFIDVGAHLGESLEVALDPRFDFSRIYALEPASTCVSILEKYRDTRVVVCPFGLSDKDHSADLFGAGLLGASIYSQKEFLDPRSPDMVERIELRRASTWLEENTEQGDEIFLKLNCEGSECDI
jgi:FkbM family methyltransferase